MYGLINGKKEIKNIINKVCSCLGNGNNNSAHLLLLETCGAETNFGKFEDKTNLAGMGLTQFDRLPFYDVKSRIKSIDKKKIKNYFGIDIDLVEWEHLRYSPLLSILFSRLKYKLIPDHIPKSIENRAIYYKIWYNTIYGKGTIKHYFEINGYSELYNKDLEVTEKNIDGFKKMLKV